MSKRCSILGPGVGGAVTGAAPNLVSLLTRHGYVAFYAPSQPLQMFSLIQRKAFHLQLFVGTMEKELIIGIIPLPEIASSLYPTEIRVRIPPPQSL
jgi:hypothetical protein